MAGVGPDDLQNLFQLQPFSDSMIQSWTKDDKLPKLLFLSLKFCISSISCLSHGHNFHGQCFSHSSCLGKGCFHLAFSYSSSKSKMSWNKNFIKRYSDQETTSPTCKVHKEQQNSGGWESPVVRNQLLQPSWSICCCSLAEQHTGVDWTSLEHLFFICNITLRYSNNFHA